MPGEQRATVRPLVKAPTTIELGHRVEALEAQHAQTTWYLAELIYKMKLAAAAQLLSSPAVQEQLAAALAAKIG